MTTTTRIVSLILMVGVGSVISTVVSPGRQGVAEPLSRCDRITWTMFPLFPEVKPVVTALKTATAAKTAMAAAAYPSFQASKMKTEMTDLILTVSCQVFQTTALRQSPIHHLLLQVSSLKEHQWFAVTVVTTWRRINTVALCSPIK